MKLFSNTVKTLIPPEPLTISQWAEKYRVLTSPSEEKGPLKNIRTPYLVPIMDACLDPHVEQVVFCKPAQIAGTEAMLNIIGYYSHRESCSIMLVLADEDTALYTCRERLQKVYRKSPGLKYLIQEEKFGQKEITLTNDSYIAIGWASSVAKLGSRPIKLIIFDEVDKPGYYVTTREATPISLGIERTETFYNRKILILSTPTIEEGNIWEYLNNCDVIYDWHVPCPHCGQMQPLRWSKKHAAEFKDGLFRGQDGKNHTLGSVVWEGGREATQSQIDKAGYECGECKELWTTVQKNNAVEKGRMVARVEHKERPASVGYHINRLYSLLGKSGDIPKLVNDWIKCQDNVRKIQGFINSTLAEPWRNVITTSTEAEVLKARCDLPPQTVPEDAVALTAGIDVQKYGFWFVVRAWLANYTSWLIHYGELAAWDDVEKLLFEIKYPVQGSSQHKGIWRAAIDTGGGAKEEGMSMTEETEIWVRNNAIGRGCRVWGTKGSARPLAGILNVGKVRDQTPSGKPLKGGLRIISLDTHKLKDSYHYRLQQAIEGGPRAAYLHSGTNNQYAKHILAEEKRVDGRGVEMWVQIKARNDLFDCEILAAACADPEWPGGGVNLIGANQGTRTRGIRNKGLN